MQGNLISIGDLAKLKGVSVKSLRYYDRIGILKPAYVNPNTGYRYYMPEQIIVLDVILLCLTFHLPLKLLQDYCGDVDSVPDLKQIILDGHAQALEKMKEAQKTLALSSDLMDQIERLNQPHEEKELYGQFFPLRAALTLPWKATNNSGKAYIKIIAELHQRARDAGLTILSGQGILHEAPLSDNIQSVFLAVKPSVCKEEGYREFPSGNYSCMVLQERDIAQLANILSGRGMHPDIALCLNTDIYDYCLAHHLHWFEIQAL